MVQYRISVPAQTDIVDILRHSQAQFGTAARQRYQRLILTALEGLAVAPHRIGSSFRDDIAPNLKSIHLHYWRKHSATTHGVVLKPRHIIFYRLADDNFIEVVRILHDAMESRLHLPEG